MPDHTRYLLPIVIPCSEFRNKNNFYKIIFQAFFFQKKDKVHPLKYCEIISLNLDATISKSLATDIQDSA